MALWARWWEGEGRSDADNMRRCPLSSVGGVPEAAGRGCGSAGGGGARLALPLLVKPRSASSVP